MSENVFEIMEQSCSTLNLDFSSKELSVLAVDLVNAAKRGWDESRMTKFTPLIYDSPQRMILSSGFEGLD